MQSLKSIRLAEVDNFFKQSFEQKKLIPQYCKTPLISTYIFSGLATEQVLIFGAVLIFGGYNKAEAKVLQGRSLFNPVLSAHKTQLCMFQRLCTYFQDTGVLIFGGYVLSGHCNQQQISVKTEGVLIFGGVLIYGVYGS